MDNSTVKEPAKEPETPLKKQRTQIIVAGGAPSVPESLALEEPALATPEETEKLLSKFKGFRARRNP